MATIKVRVLLQVVLVEFVKDRLLKLAGVKLKEPQPIFESVSQKAQLAKQLAADATQTTELRLSVINSLKSFPSVILAIASEKAG